MVYFDHNATTPLLPEAQQAWIDASERFIGNPSSPHRLGARADAALDNTREQLASMLGCEPQDIVWTSGATESNNMALHHFAQSLDRRAEVWVSAIEHPCVLAATAHYFPNRHRLMPVAQSGAVLVDWLRDELARRRPGMIAVLAASNETGVLQPWQEILSICNSHGIPFFCDAAQWLGKLPANGLGACDFLSGCAHKFGGPRGVGFLKCPPKGRVHPFLLGGKQEQGRRAGTENVPGVLAMMKALELRQTALANREHEPRAKWRVAFENLLTAQLPGVVVVGNNQHRLWNTVSAIMPSAQNQKRWVVKLDKLGFAVSTGSACASGSEEPSHVLLAMGYSPDQTSRALRFSSGWETTQQDWHALTEALLAVYKEMSG